MSENSPLIQAHFPVGPLGRSRLWHSGIHLMAGEGKPIFSPLMGEIVAAKVGPACPVGSCNFVLVKHKLFSRRRELPVFSLFFHLQQEQDTQESLNTPPWIIRSRKKAWRDKLLRGEVVQLNEPVREGEVLGHVGLAGPPGQRNPQIHFAIFASKELGKELDPTYWLVVEGDGKSRLCDDPTIIDKIDKPHGGKRRDSRLSRRELVQFFAGDPRRDDLHQLAVRCRAEWTPSDWEADLAEAGDFAALDAAERRRLIAQQITPTLWWTPAIARHAGLPQDGVIFAYHPIGFLLWFKDLAKRTANEQAVELADASQYTYDPGSERFNLDGDSQVDMVDEEDLFSGDAGKKLTLEDLLEGYPDDEE